MILIGWRGHTDRSRSLALAFRGAVAACGWTEAYAAECMGLTLPQLSRQLSGVEPLNAYRIEQLSDEFHKEYDARRAGRRGAIVLEPEQVMLIRGALVLGKAKMAKCAPQLVEEDTAERQRA